MSTTIMTAVTAEEFRHQATQTEVTVAWQAFWAARSAYDKARSARCAAAKKVGREVYVSSTDADGVLAGGRYWVVGDVRASQVLASSDGTFWVLDNGQLHAVDDALSEFVAED